ncbi:MAG TPA: hypothetical protein DCS93_35665 [Microscillaceae bacterium]|nr:hypothetical protein [Microscillaceae bacterium]
MWVSNITYLRITDSFGNLSLIIDTYSRKVVGDHLHQDLGTEDCMSALKMTLQSQIKNVELSHYPDQRIQCCSNDYVNMLIKHEVKISMTENGDPRENAVAEDADIMVVFESFRTIIYV